jgi:hypothetical protein
VLGATLDSPAVTIPIPSPLDPPDTETGDAPPSQTFGVAPPSPVVVTDDVSQQMSDFLTPLPRDARLAVADGVQRPTHHYWYRPEFLIAVSTLALTFFATVLAWFSFKAQRNTSAKS